MLAKFLDLNEFQEDFEKHRKRKLNFFFVTNFEKNPVKNLELDFVENYVIFKDFLTNYLANI